MFLGGLPWPAMALDPTGTVTYANDHVAALGFDPRQMQGRHFEALLPAYVRALRGDPSWLTPQDAEVTRSGEHGHVHEHVWVRPLPEGAYVIVVDETASRMNELDQAQTARMASIGFMLSGVCHEVSNPLAATYSMVQILQSQENLPEHVMREGLEKIAVNVQRILDVSRRINEFCRVGKPGSVRVDDAVEEALALLNEDRRYRGVAIKHVPNPQAIVSSDVGHLRQIFYNLALNACQAMGGSGELIIRSECDGAGRVKIFVEDTGPGVPQEHLERLFEPFFTTKPSGEGTGLGLSITRDLVWEHRGAISVSNRPENGARFELDFPEETHSS